MTGPAPPPNHVTATASRSQLFIHGVALLLLSSSFTLHAKTSTIQFGRLSDWQTALLNGLEIIREGKDHARISPLSQEWRVDESTDLLLHFNQQREFDLTGRHRLTNAYQLSPSSAQGGGALFLNGQNGPILSPSPTSFLGGGYDSSTFSIQFWFKPRYAANGEVLFEWDGLVQNNGLELPQHLSAYFAEQRLVWEIENLLLHPDKLGSKVYLRSDPLVPNRWYHHHLHYDATSHQIELLIDNRVVDVIHSTINHRAGGEPQTLMLSNPNSYPFVIGKNFHGYVDEFRISTSYTPPLYLRSPVYRSRSAAVIGPINLETADATLTSLHANYSTPDRSQMLIYFALLNDPHRVNKRALLDLNPVSSEDDLLWQRIIPGQPLKDEQSTQRGMYLYLKVIFLGDRESLHRPWLSQLEINYNQPRTLPPPGNILVQQIAADALQVSWQPIADRRVAGYSIYLGQRSKVYLQQSLSLDAGSQNSYIIRNLEPMQQYFLTMAAYDHNNPAQTGQFSAEKNIHLLPYFGPDAVQSGSPAY